MIDSGCTTTLIRLAGTSKSHRASIISKPLFIIVAESMVTFDPIFQFGCLSASEATAEAILSLGQVLNGPPEAVRCILHNSLP